MGDSGSGSDSDSVGVGKNCGNFLQLNHDTTLPLPPSPPLSLSLK